MTHFQKLNSVLHVLLASETKLFADKPLRDVFTLEWICRKVAGAEDDWEVGFICNRLINDGYVKIDLVDGWQKPSLTPPGVKFIQAGGYVQEARDRELDQQIKQQTLKSLHRSKSALIISIFAIVVPSIISIIALVVSTTGPTKEEVQELREQARKLTDQHYHQQRILDSLRIVNADTLTKGKSGR